MALAPFDADRFRSAVDEIRTLTIEPPEIFEPANDGAVSVERRCAGVREADQPDASVRFRAMVPKKKPMPGPRMCWSDGSGFGIS